MRTAYLRMLNDTPPRFFKGASDNPTGQPGHAGAYDRDTGHAHLDPWVFSRLATNPNFQWLAMLTGMHEAAHDLGYSHMRQPVMFSWRGFKIGIFEKQDDPYFAALNPGDATDSCLKY